MRKLGVRAPKENPDIAALGLSTDSADIEAYMDVLEDGTDPLVLMTEESKDGSAGRDSSSEDDETGGEDFKGTNQIDGLAVGAMPPSTERGVVNLGVDRGDTHISSTAESDEEESSDDEKIDSNTVLTAEERAAIEQRNAEKRERRAREVTPQLSQCRLSGSFPFLLDN